VIIYSYFASKRGLDDKVGFSCDSIVKWCGYQPNYNKNKINSQITNILSVLLSNDYIEISDTVNRNNFIEAMLNIGKFAISSQFALIYMDEIKKIRDFNKNNDPRKVSSAILLLLLSYIRLNMLRRQKKYKGKPFDKPEFCYRLYIDIEKDIGISSRYISKGIKELEDLDLLVVQRLPRWKDENNNWHTEVTLFANKYKRKDNGDSLDSDYDYKQELLWGIDYIKGKKYLNKKNDINNESEVNTNANAKE
jgi:hypothetical protein